MARKTNTVKGGKDEAVRAKKHRARVKKLTNEFNAISPAQPAPRDKTVDVYHGVKVPDPYRPLEQLEDKATLDWAWGQMDRFQEFVSDSPALKRVTKYLEDNWDYPTESMPAKRGKFTFTYRNNGKQGQSVYYVQDEGAKKARVLIDPNKFSKDGSLALKGTSVTRDGTLVAYKVAEGGGDDMTIKVRDVATGKDLPDTIEKCRFTGVDWDEDNKGFIYAYKDPTNEERFEVRHHTLGEDVSKDTLVFRLSDEDDADFSSLYRPRDIKSWEFIFTHKGTDPANGLLIRKKGTDDEFKPFFTRGQNDLTPFAEVDGKILATTNVDAVRSRVVAVDPANPEPENWEEIIPEHSEDLMGGAWVHKGRLFVSYTHDTADRLAMFDLKGNHIHDAPLPEQSEFSMGYINDEDDEFQMQISGFNQSGDTWKWDFEKNTLDFVKKSPSKFDKSDLVVERIHATSKDGTKVPMTVVRRKDVKLDGSAAVKLYGYGGFNVPLGPGLGVGSLAWVREGGIYVQANLRGGGEYGSDWYNQGRLGNKQNVFDDFIACAEHLINEKYTSAERCSIDGGSNGGLLTLATMVQRPDLFGAVISQVPVTDMYRFMEFTYGRAWVSDYGDASKSKKDFDVASKYSPLHNVKKGQNYPPSLVTTADHDDRVVPSHAYKFVATLQALAGKDTLSLLRVEKNGSHGGGVNKHQTINEIAEKIAFLEKTMGPIDQNAYKASLKAGAAANNNARRKKTAKPARRNIA